MATVRALLAAGASALPGDAARREVALLLGYACDKTDAWLIAHSGDAMDAECAARFERLVARRAAGEPVAYLTGRRGFHALELDVTPDVLIPRAETELLVDCALQRLPESMPSIVADLGTGSGALALAIAHARPLVRVLATDASAAALRVARGNAERLGLGNVAFAEGDWCAALGADAFDMIVSNPPYIAAGDPHLTTGDLRFEPAMALASGIDGLDAVRAIVAVAPAHLNRGASLLLEHGFDQAVAVRDLLRAAGFADVATTRDLEDRDRVTGGRWP